MSVVTKNTTNLLLTGCQGLIKIFSVEWSSFNSLRTSAKIEYSLKLNSGNDLAVPCSEAISKFGFAQGASWLTEVEDSGSLVC
ncbi:MAG: hypothetical protein HC780_27535 [Leptolyngbyaceae cyanobacterium CSU_1_3]|nr:hypothetical protein [Leptolyngbyaceae cyanobacterium CSU_1_3]